MHVRPCHLATLPPGACPAGPSCWSTPAEVYEPANRNRNAHRLIYVFMVVEMKGESCRPSNTTAPLDGLNTSRD
jgi:hypothetical protein